MTDPQCWNLVETNVGCFNVVQGIRHFMLDSCMNARSNFSMLRPIKKPMFVYIQDVPTFKAERHHSASSI